MNFGNVVGKATSAASNATNAASGVASATNTAASATSGVANAANNSGIITNASPATGAASGIVDASGRPLSSNSSGVVGNRPTIVDSSGRPLNSSSSGNVTNAPTIVDESGNPLSSSSSSSDKSIEVLDDSGNNLNNSNLDSANQNGSDNPEPDENGELKEGDKVAPGKEINENGEVDKSSTRKLTEAVGRGAAAYFTGGESIGADKAIAESRMGDHLLGVVSDTAEKVPGVEQVADELNEAGVTDAVNDALDTVGSVKNMDLEGVAEGAKKTAEDVKKFKKYTVKKIAMALVPALALLLFLMAVFFIILGPVIGGFLDLTDGDSESKSSGGGYVSTSTTNTDISNLLADTPNYDELTPTRQAILAAAASLVGMPYHFGGHPAGAGLSGFPATGLDCAGYVQWVLWTALGTNPGYLTTSSISSQIGTRFIEVSADELQPGDIGLKRRGGSTSDDTNHTGIYAGGGQWYHAASTNTGIVKNNYSSFTIYLRYVGVV